MTEGYRIIHVRVNDAATGKPTPVRIRFVDPAGNRTDPDGEYLAPLGRLADFSTNLFEDVGGNLEYHGKRYAYIDGTCEIALPLGSVLVEIHKGPEFRPLRAEVAIGPGKLALRFEIERWIDLRPSGWYSGDIRAFWLSPHAARLEAAAEDLAVVNLLASEFDPLAISDCGLRIEQTKDRAAPNPQSAIRNPQWRAIPNIVAFSGQVPAVQHPNGHIVVVNTQNSHPVLGTLALLNCHRPVFPLRFGGPAGWDDWTLADWCDQCHRKGGLVVWTKDLWQTGSGFALYGEALADLILGKVDALDCNGAGWNEANWYELLNGGLRLTVVAGSAKQSNRKALGKWRTYARLMPGADFSYGSWIEAIRAGRTFITSGPLLDFTVDGHDPGVVISVSLDKPTVRVRAEARGFEAFEQLQVVVNGAVVAEAGPSGINPTATIDTEVTLPTGGWIVARCWGPTASTGPAAYAHSSPVYVQVENRPPWSDAAAVDTLLNDLGGMLDWVEHEARCATGAQRARLANIFESAKRTLREFEVGQAF